MGKMKGVLDADVENIRNAKATVEKTIEEKNAWNRSGRLYEQRGSGKLKYWKFHL